MPKGKSKCKPEDLCFDEEDVRVGRKQPSPKLKTVSADYRINRKSPDSSIYRNADTRPPPRRTNARKYWMNSPSVSSDDAASQVTVKAAPLIPTRNYNVNWRSQEDRPSNVTSCRGRARSPSTLFRSYRLRSSTPRRDNTRRKTQGDRKSPVKSSPERYHETFTLKLTTDETVELRGLKSRKLYATFPEGTYIIADAQNRGNRGERVFQRSKAFQVPEGIAGMSTFQNSFGKMRL